MVGPNGVWKGKTPVCGCQAEKSETFGWRANRVRSHLESISHKEGFMASGFKFFMGNYVKKAWEMSRLEKAEQKEELCVKYFELI